MSSSRLSVPNPDNITRVEFDNGLTLLVYENHAAPVVVLEGSLPAGAIHDPADKIGLGSFVSAMLTRGSQEYDFHLFNEAVESVGANLTTACDTHATNFGITSLSEDFADMVEILADMLRYPTFPQEQIDVVQAQKLARLQEREQDTASMAALNFFETLYGRQHPYGRTISGYIETVATIDQQDLLAFLQDNFTPHGAAIVVVGDVETNAVQELIETHLGDWSGPSVNQKTPPISQHSTEQKIVHPIADKAQTDLVIGCRAMRRDHPDFDILRVANTVLGRFGMMGRLGAHVREELGLAYYCSSSLDVERDAGAWVASAGVNPADVQRAIDAILAEFQRLVTEPIPTEELDDSQAFMTGALPIGLETNDGIAVTLLNMEWNNLGLDYLQRYNDLIYQVTPEEIQRAAGNYIQPENFVLSVSGPE